jgi:hypothetical protein
MWWKFLSLRGFISTILYGSWLSRELTRVEHTSVSIEISPGCNVLLGNVLVSMGIPFIAYPHNLEFLVPGQRQSYFRSKDAEFAAEMRIYRKADCVNTISSFDKAILLSLGVVSVESLPYLPSEFDLEELNEIRDLRRHSHKNGILILGSVGNPPTIAGLKKLLGLIEKNGGGISFRLAGYGTEKLRFLAPPCVEVKGSVTAGELQKLMVECQALLVYQPPTSGMLTRLVEAVHADIPIYVMGGYLQALELKDRNVVSISDLYDLPH